MNKATTEYIIFLDVVDTVVRYLNTIGSLGIEFDYELEKSYIVHKMVALRKNNEDL